MFKIAGVTCILAGCTGWGISRIVEERNRVQHLREMIRIIRRIRDEISYGKHTLPEICLILSEYCSASFQSCFRQIYEQVGQGEGTSFRQIWERQIGLCMRDAPLSEEEKDILGKLPYNLGMQEEKLQAENISQSMEFLVRECRRAEDAYDNKSRMILSVSVLMGVFLTILLL